MLCPRAPASHDRRDLAVAACRVGQCRASASSPPMLGADGTLAIPPPVPQFPRMERKAYRDRPKAQFPPRRRGVKVAL
jgi:hypothetical protein